MTAASSTEPSAVIAASLVSASFDPAIATDAQGRILATNAAAEELLGLPAQGQGRVLRELIQDGSDRERYDALTRARQPAEMTALLASGGRARIRLAFVDTPSQKIGVCVIRPETLDQDLLTLLRALPLPAALLAGSLALLDCNDAFIDLFGVARDQLAGSRLRDAIGESLPEEFEEHDEKALASTQPGFVCHVQTLADGSKRVLRVHRIPLRAAAAGAPRLIIAIENISEQLRDGSGLAVDGRLVQTILDYMPGFISLKDAKTRKFLFATGTDRVIVDKPASYLIGKSASQLYEPALADAIDNAEQDLLDHPERMVEGRHARMVADQQRWFYSRKLVVPDERQQAQHILTFNLDVTHEMETEQALGRANRFLDTLFDTLPLLLAVQEIDTRRIVRVNPAFVAFFGRDGGSLIGATANDLGIGNPADEAIRVVGEHLQEVEGANGRRWLRTLEALVPGESGQPRYVMSLHEDVTERLAAERELSENRTFLDTILRHLPWPLTVTDARNGGVLLANTAAMARTLVAEKSGDASGSDRHDAFAADMAKLDRRLLAVPSRAIDEEVLQRTEQGETWHHVRKVGVTDEAGDCRYILTIDEDVTERFESQRRIRFLALYDSLTWLGNRTKFDETLTTALAQAGRSHTGIALHCLDITDLRGVNDTLGHVAGDELLRQAASRLKECVPDQGLLARLGSDEFAIIQPQVDGPEKAAELAAQLTKSFARPFLVAGQEVHSGASIGITLLQDGTTTPTELLREADMALNAAKEAGRGSFRFFTQELRATLLERRRIESRLRLALDEDRLDLAFQPLVDLKTMRLRGVEALVRWNDPELGQVSPGRFVPVAEETAQILQLGQFVLRRACREAQAWRSAGLEMPCVAVNLSPAQFAYQDLVEMVSDTLAETGLPAEALELEITEGVLMRDRQGAIATLEALQSLGVRVALDDFGTGYSSLSYLKRFPIDKLKIDRSFVTDLPADKDDIAIVRTIVALGRALGLTIVAEGVETRGQHEFLLAEGCMLGQGYLYAKPMPAQSIADLLRHEPAFAATA